MNVDGAPIFDVNRPKDITEEQQRNFLRLVDGVILFIVGDARQVVDHEIDDLAHAVTCSHGNTADAHGRA